MVETQQGVSTFLSFGAKSVKPEILEELLIGRRENVDLLSKFVKEIAEDGLNHHKIVIGQRGTGKPTF
jgi:Cdc6-like AAA superfamily ATPase